MSVFDHVGLLVALIGVSSRRTLGRLRAGVLRQLRSERGGRGRGREEGGWRTMGEGLQWRVVHMLSGAERRAALRSALCCCAARCLVRYVAERAAGG